MVSEIQQFPHDFNIEIVTNKYFSNYKHVLEMFIAFQCTNAFCPPCDMSPLCFAQSTKVTCPSCHLCAASSWTKLNMSPKYVCRFSTKTAENYWKYPCTRKAWLILVTWHQKVQMTQNCICHLCALNRLYILLVSWSSNTPLTVINLCLYIPCLQTSSR